VTTYVALLRGINVSGKNPIKMAALRELVASLGHRDVVTYVQSGNAVFRGTGSASTIGTAIEARITQDLGLTVTVLVRTEKEIAALLERTPPVGASDLEHLHVTFLAQKPTAAAIGALDVARYAPDDCRVLDRAVYVHCPNGYGRTKLNNTYFERQLAVAATTRSWKTVTRIGDEVVRS
jgi:uncharacterized protein (DUF1697 family)